MKRSLSILALISLLTTLLAGCQNKDAGNTVSVLSTGMTKYPIESKEKILIWESLTANISGSAPSANDLPFTKELIKRTGIQIEYVHPPLGQELEKFNLMLSSGELADIIRYPLTTTKEGPDKLIESGYVYPLSNDFLTNYAPNFKKMLDSDKELVRICKTNNNNFYAFLSMREDDSMTVFQGPIIRKDWLDELKLSVPETIAEWHNVLTAFKEKKGAQAALSFQGLNGIFGIGGAFIGAYGIKKEFYAENGKIKYGVIEAGYKDFLTEMNRWYKDGLIDKNFSAVTPEELTTKVLNGNTGSSYGMIGSRLGSWLSAKKGESFNLVAAPYPTLNNGEIAKFGAKNTRYDEPQYFISATSKNKELATRFLDYGYTQEGKMFYNFGIEGESYKMVDGNPVYTDLVMNNKDGLSSAVALARYTHASYEGPFEMDKRFFKQQYPFEQQKNAIDVWAKTKASDYIVYGDTTITSDENNELSTIMTDVSSYVNEMSTKYIMGIESLDSFDKFIAQVKSMNIDKAIAVKQASYDRYMTK